MSDRRDDVPQVELRPFVPERDVPLVSVWLSRPHVARWWGNPERALSELSAHDANAVALIAVDDRPVGLVCWQTPSRSELEDAGLGDLPEDLVDVDIMIGEPEALGRGVGPAALLTLFAALRESGVRLVGLAGAIENRRAMGAYARAGLRPHRDFTEGGEAYRYFTARLAEEA